MTSSPATALTRREDAPLVTDARTLSVEQIVDIISSSDKRAIVMGTVTAAIAIAVAELSGAVVGEIALAAALVVLPAFLAGYFMAAYGGNRAAAAEHGVTLACMRDVRRAFGRVEMRQDIRKIPMRESRTHEVDRLAHVVKDELAKKT